MLIPTILIGVLAIVLLFIGYMKGQDQHIIGVKSALNMIVEILPRLIFAFIMAGMIQVLIPHELISKWVGVESGMRGILIGTVVGGLSPGVHTLAYRLSPVYYDPVLVWERWLHT